MWATSHEAEEQSAWEERQAWLKPMGVGDKDPHLPSSPGEAATSERTANLSRANWRGKNTEPVLARRTHNLQSWTYQAFEGFIQFDWPLSSVWQDNCDNVFTSRALKKLLVLSHLKTGMIIRKTTKGTWTTRRIIYLPWLFNICP